MHFSAFKAQHDKLLRCSASREFLGEILLDFDRKGMNRISNAPKIKSS